MSRKWSFLFVLLAIVLAITPVFAQDPEGQVVVESGGTVKIGLATDLSNLIPAPGQDIANGAQIAVNQFNEMGGVQGFQVELLVEDDLCTGEGATAVANKFAATEDLVAVVGHVCSGASIPASDIYEVARIPMVSPSSTAFAFTSRDLDVTNRVAFNDAIQGVVVARYAYSELEVESIAIVHDNSAYGLGLSETVRDTFEELGGEVTEFQAINPDEQDYRSVLRVIQESEPELVYFGGYTNQAALLVEQMAELGFEDVYFFSDDGVYNQDFLDLAADNGEGAYVSFGEQVGNEEANAEFDAIYEETFGVAPDELGPFHAQAYDSAMVILNALASVATVDADGNLVVDREALIEAIRATADYQGLSGTITCNEIGDCGSALISVFVAEDGAWVQVEVPEELQVGGDADAEESEDGAEAEATEEAGS